MGGPKKVLGVFSSCLGRWRARGQRLLPNRRGILRGREYLGKILEQKLGAVGGQNMPAGSNLCLHRCQTQRCPLLGPGRTEQCPQHRSQHSVVTCVWVEGKEAELGGLPGELLHLLCPQAGCRAGTRETPLTCWVPKPQVMLSPCSWHWGSKATKVGDVSHMQEPFHLGVPR